MNRKGIAGFTPLLIVGIIFSLTIFGILNGSTEATVDFVKEKTLSLQTDRVVNAALSINSLPRGYINLDLDGYEFQLVGDNVTMRYNGEVDTRELEDNLMRYDSYDGPGDWETINGSLCLRKTIEGRETILEFDTQGCSA